MVNKFPKFVYKDKYADSKDRPAELQHIIDFREDGVPAQGDEELGRRSS
jgi:hypothetical protein